MAINYKDSRFTELEKDKNTAIKQSNSTYDNLIKDSKGYYDKLIAQSKDYADQKAEIQNQQTDFTIQKIEQQKDKAEKDYTKEQKGAYQDYMKQSNAYGSNMQAAGQQGLGGSGWSETIQSGFYNTYQNRYAQARENYNTIVMNYDNNIKEAELQNSSALMEIYSQAQAEQLELSLQSFTVIKDLKLAKQDKYLAIDDMYNTRWRQVEQQINTENALAEQIRQYNATLAEQKRQADMDNAYKQQQLALAKQELAQKQAQWQAEFNLAKSKASSGGSSGGSRGSGGSGGGSGSEPTLKETKKETLKETKQETKGTVKLSNGKTGYSSAITAYQKSGGRTPYSASALVSKGYVKSYKYNGKTYYYVP